MPETAKKTDPKLWERVKDRITKSSKGGRAGQWSARKAQLATAEYKKEGGGYEGGRSRGNHLTQWTDEQWGTKSGHDSRTTGERYLPKEARESLSEGEYARTSRKKRADSAKGRQFSPQPQDIARRTASIRKSSKRSEPTKTELMQRAKARNIRGRSNMTKSELQQVLGPS